MVELNTSRRVRALRKAYVAHVIRKEGEEFAYSGAPNPDVFLELEAGDTSPIRSSVPRDAAAVDDGIDDLL